MRQVKRKKEKKKKSQKQIIKKAIRKCLQKTKEVENIHFCFLQTMKARSEHNVVNILARSWGYVLG